MSLPKWKKLNQKELDKNPWWVYRQDSFELPNGELGEYFYVHTNGASMTIPLLHDGRLVMVRQYRYLCDRESLEFPCGGVKGGSDFRQTAIRELAEEAGYQAEAWEAVGEFNPYNGVTNEMCRVYVARNLKEVRAQSDPTEQFEKIFLTPDELDARIMSGEIWDGMTLAGWLIARSHVLSK